MASNTRQTARDEEQARAPHPSGFVRCMRGSSAMKRTVLLLAMSALNAALAAGAPVSGQFPPWAERVWTRLAGETALQLSARLNPFVWRGDFNGDGRQDLAVLVFDTVSKKEGVVFLLQGAKPAIVGAGRDFGNAGDDFSWMDTWHVADRGPGPASHCGQRITLKRDGLFVAKESSASALIHFRNGKPVWQQCGD
jgi:hypothetical protein